MMQLHPASKPFQGQPVLDSLTRPLGTDQRDWFPAADEQRVEHLRLGNRSSSAQTVDAVRRRQQPLDREEDHGRLWETGVKFFTSQRS
jgi:hypothetical protein